MENLEKSKGECCEWIFLMTRKVMVMRCVCMYVEASVSHCKPEREDMRK